METLLIEDGTVVTQDADRTVINNGSITIEDDSIVAVGSRERVRDEYDADQVIDASDHFVVPSFVNTRMHIPGILLKGCCGTDRGRYGLLFNVKQPGMASMKAEDHEFAAALYATEAI